MSELKRPYILDVPYEPSIHQRRDVELLHAYALKLEVNAERFQQLREELRSSKTERQTIVIQLGGLRRANGHLTKDKDRLLARIEALEAIVDRKDRVAALLIQQFIEITKSTRADELCKAYALDDYETIMEITAEAAAKEGATK